MYCIEKSKLSETFAFIHYTKNEVEYNLDLVTINLATNYDLVAILQKAIFQILLGSYYTYWSYENVLFGNFLYFSKMRIV